MQVVGIVTINLCRVSVYDILNELYVCVKSLLNGCIHMSRNTLKQRQTNRRSNTADNVSSE
jgi:hypothetical protein